jgi:hypothetical protein
MSSSKEGQVFGQSEFWDERYAKAAVEDEKPTHEWLRSFTALQPFFDKHLFHERGPDGRSERILHLGSGDSVSLLMALPWSLLIA